MVAVIRASTAAKGRGRKVSRGIVTDGGFEVLQYPYSDYLTAEEPNPIHPYVNNL